MKKLFAIVCAVAMLCSFAIVASADGVGTADYAYTSEGGIAIDVIDDFSSYSADLSGIFKDAQYTFDGEKLVWDIYTGGWCYDGPSADVPSASYEGIADAYNAAEYIGFQVKNTGEVAGVIAFEKDTNWAMQIWGEGEGIKLVSVDGGIVDAEIVDINAIYRGKAVSIPAGFDGWVFIPFATMRPYIDENWSGEKANSECIFEKLEFCGTCVEGEEQFAVLEIDNLFLAASLDVDTSVTPPVKEDPTEVPTEAPTEAPTAASTDDNGAAVPTDDATQTPADTDGGFPVWIVIAVAAVVVIVVVVVVASKKKSAQ